MFVNNFVGAKGISIHRPFVEHKQGENESVRTFISHFNREALLVDGMDDKILLTTFYNGVNSDLFIHKLYD